MTQGISVETTLANKSEIEVGRGLARDAAVREAPFRLSARRSIERWIESQSEWETWIDRIGILGLMLIGLYVAKRGAVWQPEVRRNIARRALPWLMLAGVTCTMIAVYSSYIAANGPYSMPRHIVEATLGEWLGGSLMGLGYAAAFVLLFESDSWNRLLSVFAPVGRTALTCYLLTFIIWEFINLGWGLGMFGTLGPAFSLTFVLIAFSCYRHWCSRLAQEVSIRSGRMVVALDDIRAKTTDPATPGIEAPAPTAE